MKKQRKITPEIIREIITELIVMTFAMMIMPTIQKSGK